VERQIMLSSGSQARLEPIPPVRRILRRRD
jgi:hypothetical protein